MSINKRIFDTMKRKKITQETLAKELNTSQSVIAGWKNRGTSPSMEYLPKICEVLDVTWEYIITGERSKEHLTENEKQLINDFRYLWPEYQKEIMKYTKFKMEEQTEEILKTLPKIDDKIEI